MSFAGDVKEEVSRIEPGRYHCLKAQMAATLDICGSLEVNTHSVALLFKGSKAPVTRTVYRMLYRLGLKPQLFARRGERLRVKSSDYLVQLRGEAEVLSLYRLLGKGGLSAAYLAQSSMPLLKRECCRLSYLRGAFLAGGSVNDPGNSYHLELVVESDLHAEVLHSIMLDLGLTAGSFHRKGNQVIYLKDRAAIADFLALIGAMRHRLRFEEVMMQKEMSNLANRSMNFEMANVKRIVNAGLMQYQAILYLQNSTVWATLAPSLIELANMRLEQPEASLSEIAEVLSISKSAANHRFRKLVKLAKEEGWTESLQGS